MEELVRKGPNRFEREEVKVLLEETEALGRTEKAGLKGKKTRGRKSGEKKWPLQLGLWDGSGLGKGPCCLQVVQKGSDR